MSEINANGNHRFRCWGEVLKFSTMWSKERAEKAQRYSSKRSILAARLFLFSKGSRGEMTAAVKGRNWSFVGLAHLDKWNPAARSKWIKAERWRWGGCSPFLPPNPHLPLPQVVRAKCPGKVMPGHCASILWQLLCSIPAGKVLIPPLFTDVFTPDGAGVAGACPSTCSKEVHKEESVFSRSNVGTLHLL